MDKIEEKIINIIEENKGKIKAFARDIEAHPEPGFCEKGQPCRWQRHFGDLGFIRKSSLQ